MQNNSQSIDYKESIMAILDAIDFTDNKEKFTRKFIENTKIESLFNLLDSLLPNEQEEIKQQLGEYFHDKKKTAEIITAYFTTEQIEIAYEKTIESAIAEWIGSLRDSLSAAQIEKLQTLAQRLQPSFPTTQDSS